MKTITAARLHHLLTYDPDTGVITNRVNRPPSAKAGDEAGCPRHDGYRQIKIDGNLWLSHRIAWIMTFGQWPTDDIDHINGIKDDNRIINLRLATTSENMSNRGMQANNTSGHKGVYWHKKDSKWTAQIRVNGRNKYLGQFTDPEDAAAAYKKAAPEYHGTFANF